jgi:4-hydroxy-tetrahydrodipicolinate synthase
MQQPPLAGLWPPVSTPFRSDLSLDEDKLVAHGKRLLVEGSAGLAILGTTSEANSLTIAERRRVIDACVKGGIAAGQLLPGTGACAIDDAAELSRHAADIGCAGVLLLPPFYYKKITADGLFAFVAQLIERSGPNPPRIVLYHIPPIAVVGWPTDLVARLLEAFPGIVVGMKDSSGDYDHVETMIRSFPGFAVFPGAETHLLRGLRAGAAGCISATANINARNIAALIANFEAPDAEARQERINGVRKAVEADGLVQSAKAVLAARYGDPDWAVVRPPLLPLTAEQRAALLANPAIVSLLAEDDA